MYLGRDCNQDSLLRYLAPFMISAGGSRGRQVLLLAFFPFCPSGLRLSFHPPSIAIIVDSKLEMRKTNKTIRDHYLYHSASVAKPPRQGPTLLVTSKPTAVSGTCSKLFTQRNQLSSSCESRRLYVCRLLQVLQCLRVAILHITGRNMCLV